MNTLDGAYGILPNYAARKVKRRDIARFGEKQR